MYHAPRIVVEDVDSAVLVAAGRELAIPAQVHTHAEAPRAGTPRFVLAYHLWGILIQNVPDQDSPIPRRRRKILPVLIKRNRPHRRILGHVAGYFGVDVPLARVGADAPDLDLAAESRAGRYLAVVRGAEVVATKGMSAADGLSEPEGGRSCLMDIDA